MNSFSEDENFFSLIREIIKNEEELESSVLSVDKKKRLEKQRAELHEQYMMFIIELDIVRIRETPYHKFLLDFLRKDLMVLLKLKIIGTTGIRKFLNVTKTPN